MRDTEKKSIREQEQKKNTPTVFLVLGDLGEVFAGLGELSWGFVRSWGISVRSQGGSQGVFGGSSRAHQGLTWALPGDQKR